MKTRMLLLILLLLLFSSVVVSAATLTLNPNEGKYSPVLQEASSTPRTRPTDLPPNTSSSGGPTPVPDTLVPSAVPTNVPTLSPIDGCAAAPGQPGYNVRVRANPGVQAEILQEAMNYTWYPKDPLRTPQTADDGNNDDSDGNLWYPVLVNGETGWVAGWAVRVSQQDCFGNDDPLASCPADIQALAPGQLPSHDIYFFGENCRLIDEMVYEDNRTDDLGLADFDYECPVEEVNTVYQAARAIISGKLTPTPTHYDCDPKITVNVTSNATNARPGDIVIFTYTLSNIGNGKALDLAVTFDIPAPDAVCTSGCEALAFNTLKPGESISPRAYTVQIAETAQPGRTLPVGVSVGFSFGEGEMGNMSGSADIRIVEASPPPPPPPTAAPSETSLPPTPTFTATPTATVPPPSPIPLPTDTFALFVEQSSSDASQTKFVFIGEDNYVAFSYPLLIEGPLAYPALSPDGRTLVYLQDTPDSGWMLNALTLPAASDIETQRQQIQERSLLQAPEGFTILPSQIAWSPDGSMLLITMRDEVNDVDNVYWVDANTAVQISPRRREHGLFVANASQPAYSPLMHPEEENDGLIAVVRDGRIHITRQKPSLLREVGLTDEQVLERLAAIESSLRTVPTTSECARQSQPAFAISDEYPLFFVCERGTNAALYLYQYGEPQQLDLPTDINPIQHLAPLRGWYITFDDGEEIYLVEIESDSTDVIATTSLDLASERRNALFMTWLSVAEPTT
jgi:uncharacterized repeat protein (TIGR01451 family)